MGTPENWSERNLKKCIYIDDYNVIEKFRQRDGIYHLTTRGRTTFAHASKTQVAFNRLQVDASKIGMKVNDQKTQMICISPSTNVCNLI